MIGRNVFMVFSFNSKCNLYTESIYSVAMHSISTSVFKGSVFTATHLGKS